MASFRLFAGSELSLGSCQRDLGVLGNHPAVQNMLLAPRALGLDATLTTLYLQFETEAEAALGLPPGVHSYALLPTGYHMGRFGPVRRIAFSDVVYEDRWGPDLPGSVATANRASAVLINAFSESRRIHTPRSG